MEVSRTLVKSAPELWTELEGARLSEAVGEVRVRAEERERKLHWEADGARGTALLEPSGWGTKVTITAEVEEAAADFGLWARLHGEEPIPPKHQDIERKLSDLLEGLGTPRRQPFTRE